MVLLFIFTIVTSLSAGVEPSPFKEVVNKINAIENNLESIDKRLGRVISKIMSEEGYSNPYGTENKLDAVADKLCSCKDKLENALDRLPDDDKRFPEVKYALVDVELKARSIVNRIDKLFMNSDYIDIAPERVKSNGQIIVYAAQEYIRPPSTSCSRPGETEEHTQSGSVIVEPSIEVDEDGFICNFDDWDIGFAEALAETEDIGELTDEHWKVMNYLMDYYQKFGVAPMIRKLCKETGFPLKKIYDLFPSGPAKGACKLAGLPKPTGCV